MQRVGFSCKESTLSLNHTVFLLNLIITISHLVKEREYFRTWLVNGADACAVLIGEPSHHTHHLYRTDKELSSQEYHRHKAKPLNTHLKRYTAVQAGRGLIQENKVWHRDNFDCDRQALQLTAGDSYKQRQR